MNKPKSRFPLKILLSYLVLGALAVVVSYFLYDEYRTYADTPADDPEAERIIETGTFINDVYETDSFARIALLTQSEDDFDEYLQKNEYLYERIDDLKSFIPDVGIRLQLDSIRDLLELKSENIEQLRILQLAYDQDSSLDDILREFKNFDKVVGRMNLEDIIREPEKLPRSEQRAWQRVAKLFTEINKSVDSVQEVPSITIDSMVAISRYIVLEAKRENSYTRRKLKEKENELLENELNISNQLKEIITDFDAEMYKNQVLASQARMASEERTQSILRIAGIVGFFTILLFSYLIITDFFKAEKFKRNLETAKLYAERILKSREQLMATVSHDLKTPLNTIVGYSELFSHTELSEKQHNYNKQINASAHFISKMVDDLLDFSKLEAGKLPIEEVPFSLENVLHQIAKASKDLHIEKPITLHLYVDDNLTDKIFESDPLRIQQVVNNLVSNAYKFTEKGKIQITANLLKLKKDICMVEIAVTDTGIGISEEKQELIFREFTQAESDTFQKFGGSGLGLAISKKIAQLLGGNLKVKSKPGKGSTFFFTIPLMISKQSKQPSIPRSRDTSLSNHMTAVIIDDDPAMLTLLKELFEQMNIKGHGFTSFEAFQKQDGLKYDFVLTDIEMPVHSGFDVLRNLKSNQNRGYQQQPIIAMTGNTQLTRKEYVDRGFSDMLQKPFSKNQLVATLSPLFINRIKIDLPRQEVFRNPSNEIYDLSFLHSFLGNTSSVSEVLDIFYEQTRKDMGQIEAAIDKFDCHGLHDVAHRMLNMCRQLNAKRVNPILETMERCALEPIPKKEMDVLYKTLQVEVKSLLAALKNENRATA